jgi:ADP-ribose pyrophosphatase YjhB (NUDIX family)
MERILLLAHPERNGIWEVISGVWEAGEALLDGVLRETREEAGPEIRVRPLCVVHTQNFHFDANIRFMIGVLFLLAYEGGQVQPGDDMAGSQYRWWRLEELEDETVRIPIPKRWVLRRAVELYRLWKDQEVVLQREL